jgi:CDP-diacylglycerol--glycerol-3-phosphate 3-phosphatidyltransferase
MAAGATGLLILFVAGWGLGRAQWAPPGWTWLAAMVWAAITLVAAGDLPLHRAHADAPLFDRLGAGTWLTLLRGLCLSGLSGFLLGHGSPGMSSWLPAILYTTSDVADYFDGYLARRSGTASPFGERLDLELDSLGLLVAVTMAVRLGSLPIWFLPLGLARYAFAGLVWLRTRRGLRVLPLPDSLARRPLAGLTMGFLSVALWPILDSMAVTIAGVAFGIPFGLGFVRDGLVVAGVFDPAGSSYRRWRGRLRRWLLAFTPLLLRFVLLVYAVVEVPQLILAGGGMVAGLARIGLADGASAARFLGGLAALAVGLVVLGLAGRFAAFALLFPLGLTTAAVGTNLVRAGGLLAAVSVLMAGTGMLSIWQPSDRVFRHRAGEAPATEDLGGAGQVRRAGTANSSHSG